MGAENGSEQADEKHLSSKLKTMKFMQRSEDRARADAEQKIEQKRVDESHWRAIYADSVFSKSTPRTVEYETSYLKMPSGDTAVKSDGTRGEGGNSSIALGRKSFKSFNVQVEQANKDVEMRERDEQGEKTTIVDDEEMAKKLSTSRSNEPKEPKPVSLRQRNSEHKRKRT
ncbi:hypothetical protein GGH96_000230 [Coemansia sp. RSA 1972]|nr:hypothetical protein GGH96_000230 [Coemansia sp. RSA 1972]